MKQHQIQNERSAHARHRDAHRTREKVFWSLGWMIFALPWLLIFSLMLLFPWIQTFWWPFILPIVLMIMFMGMFFLYVIFPKTRNGRQRRTSQNASEYPLTPPQDRMYEQGYGQQRAEDSRKNDADISQFQSRSIWDDEQPQASYPDQIPPASP